MKLAARDEPLISAWGSGVHDSCVLRRQSSVGPLCYGIKEGARLGQARVSTTKSGRKQEKRMVRG